jgi:hypothetical protein
LRNRLGVLVCILASTAAAQQSSYLGPGVLSRGAGDIGNRGGQQVDLRFFADVTGVYDNGLQPFAVGPNGTLPEVKGLYGVEASLGAYGTHTWKRALLGLDYKGDFYHYPSGSFYDGSTHNLTLGYTFQKSRRLAFDFRQLAGTSSRAYGGPGFYGSNATPYDVVNQPTTLLFDSRTYYLQSTMDVNFITSARTTYTVGGDGYTVKRQAGGLIGVNGYDLHGRIQHRLSKTRTVGVTYEHSHYDFPPAFGEADINNYQGFFSDKLGRRWTFSVSAGVFQADVVGIQQVALNPVIAALLGQTTASQAFSRSTFYPSGTASLSGNFKTSTIGFSYARTVTPGNGVYLTSRQESGTLSYGYTGIRKWNFGLSGSYNKLTSVGQGIQPYSLFNGGAGFTYGINKAFHVIGRYDARHQAIDLAGYRRTSYRATLGLAFSPGDKPLSLW